MVRGVRPPATQGILCPMALLLSHYFLGSLVNLPEIVVTSLYIWSFQNFCLGTSVLGFVPLTLLLRGAWGSETGQSEKVEDRSVEVSPVPCGK